jgi:thiamine kinase-like enzyme
VNSQGIYRVETGEIRGALEEVLGRYFEFSRVIRRMNRRRSLHSSSYAIENIEVELDDGQRWRMVLKDMSPNSVLAFQHHVRPSLVYQPEREIEVYHKILDPRLGTPICYGSPPGPGQPYWLFLERVDGRPLWQFGRLEPWQEAARWLARLHTELDSKNQASGIPTSHYLLRYDERFFSMWLERAERFLGRKAAFRASEIRHRFRRLANRYDRVLDKLRRLPTSFVHGEFYASNILVRSWARGSKTIRSVGRDDRKGTKGSLGSGTPYRPGTNGALLSDAPYRSCICPIDWEMAGIGPGLIDLAALTAGNWSDDCRRMMVAAYGETLGTENGWTGSLTDLLEAVDYCQLQLCLQWLGWAESWSPPEEHAQDWLCEALRLGEKLGLCAHPVPISWNKPTAPAGLRALG